MLAYPAYAQLLKKMQEISGLTNELKRPGGDFFKACLAYLEQLQKMCDELNLYIGADVALTAEKLLVFKPRAATDKTVRPNPKKERDAYAVQCMDTLVGEIKPFINKYRETYEQCSDLWRQVLSRLKARYSLDEQEMTSDRKLIYLLSIILADSELSPYYIHINGLVGSVNAKILLDVTLPQLEI